MPLLTAKRAALCVCVCCSGFEISRMLTVAERLLTKPQTFLQRLLVDDNAISGDSTTGYKTVARIKPVLAFKQEEEDHFPGGGGIQINMLDEALTTKDHTMSWIE
ncbi:hypothetical protein N3K66_000906 [Trichothecium roseum]|uniref:Uncharacterized protein n=1 Tax=Trichothecium roseum TaxID=47278 RepID=A0ACC0VD55_9HYPO|nr:hypothetical protein N3K66_000906 [Trichothecium roseum]